MKKGLEWAKNTRLAIEAAEETERQKRAAKRQREESIRELVGTFPSEAVIAELREKILLICDSYSKKGKGSVTFQLDMGNRCIAFPDGERNKSKSFVQFLTHVDSILSPESKEDRFLLFGFCQKEYVQFCIALSNEYGVAANLRIENAAKYPYVFEVTMTWGQ
jgi:hypothetical protein